jgi:hypothetical protein
MATLTNERKRFIAGRMAYFIAEIQKAQRIIEDANKGLNELVKIVDEASGSIPPGGFYPLKVRNQ